MSCGEANRSHYYSVCSCTFHTLCEKERLMHFHKLADKLQVSFVALYSLEKL